MKVVLATTDLMAFAQLYLRVVDWSSYISQQLTLPWKPLKGMAPDDQFVMCREDDTRDFGTH